MGKFIYLLSFLASLDPTYQDAGNTTRQAILETPEMKQEVAELKDEAEIQFYHKTGLTKDNLLYFGYAYPLITGKISTKPLDQLKYTTKSEFVVRPIIEYNLRSAETTYMITILRNY